jgi:hypothetical protein
VVQMQRHRRRNRTRRGLKGAGKGPGRGHVLFVAGKGVQHDDDRLGHPLGGCARRVRHVVVAAFKRDDRRVRPFGLVQQFPDGFNRHDTPPQKRVRNRISCFIIFPVLGFIIRRAAGSVNARSRPREGRRRH